MKWAAATLAVCLAVAAHAQAPPPLQPLPRALYDDARTQEAAGHLDQAASGYRAVLRVDPSCAQAAVDLGRVREAQGDLSGAEDAYRMAPTGDVDALLALGKVQLRAGDAADAVKTFEQLRVYETDSSEPLRWLAVATTPLDPDRAAKLFRDYLGAPDPPADPADVADAALGVAQALADRDELDAGLSLLDGTEKALPEITGQPAWATGRERLEVARDARRLAHTAARPLDAGQRARLVVARKRLAAGDLPGAASLLRDLLGEDRRAPEVWATLASVYEARGDVAAADRALQEAEALSPFEPRYPAALGDLLAKWYGGRQDQAAADAYGRALRLDPTWGDLWWRRAQVEQRAGDLQVAETSYRRYTELEPEGAHAVDALRIAEGRHRQRPAAPEVPQAPGCPQDVPQAACDAFWRAVAWQKRGRVPEALSELEGVRVAAPRFVKALNLEASLRLQQGDRDAAVDLYRQSLKGDPNQDLPLLLLWELLRQQGQDAQAQAVLAGAEKNGVGIAEYLLAREAWEGWRPFEARRRLTAYFASESSGRYHDRAVALQEEVDRFLHRAEALLAALLVCGAVGVPLLWLRRRSGVGVEDLLERSPSAYPDVARLGSAIRHEVLEHHTSVLPAVADALDRDEPEPAWWAAERLYGPEGAIARFRGYLRDLEVVGRVHGVRLNLRHRDPVFGPLIAAMDRLEALSRDLHRGEAHGLAGRLRAVSEVLNHRGYRALGALLRRVCLLRLEPDGIRSAWERVCAEHPERPAPSFEVHLPEEPVYLRIYRADLRDVLVNVLRNAVEAGATRLAVRGEVEQDWVTGLERAALRVCDDVPARLTTAVIRGRYIERGLGLTVDLISRSGGSIHVEEEPGWSKAVVIRLPRAEAPEAALQEAVTSATPQRAEAR